MAHTDLGRDAYETHNWGNYDLVVIDESYNFRNNARGKAQDDGPPQGNTLRVSDGAGS